jgi:hypothetical protein
MSVEAREHLRALSRQIFGNRHRIEVMVAIASGDKHFYLRDLSNRTLIPDATIAPIVRELSTDLVKALPRATGNGRRYYERQDHPAWASLLAFRRAIDPAYESEVVASGST